MAIGYIYTGNDSIPAAGATQASAVDMPMGSYGNIVVSGARDSSKAVYRVESGTLEGWYTFTASATGLVYIIFESGSVSVWQGDDIRGARWNGAGLVYLHQPVIRNEEYTIRLAPNSDSGPYLLLVSKVAPAVSSFVEMEGVTQFADQYENPDGTPRPLNSTPYIIIGQPGADPSPTNYIFDVNRLAHIQSGASVELALVRFTMLGAAIPAEAQPYVDKYGLDQVMADVAFEIYGMDLSWSAVPDAPFPNNDGICFAFRYWANGSNLFYWPYGYPYKPEERRTRWLSLRSGSGGLVVRASDVVAGTIPDAFGLGYELSRYTFSNTAGQGYRAHTDNPDGIYPVSGDEHEGNEPDFYPAMSGMRVWWFIEEGEPVVRKHPVDHGRGFSSSKRTFPESSIRRVVGGFE